MPNRAYPLRKNRLSARPGLGMVVVASRLLLSAVAFPLLLLSCDFSGPAGPQGPAGPSGTGIDALSDSTILPIVIHTWPADNQVGVVDSVNWRIVAIQFNKLMDPALPHDAITMSPSDSEWCFLGAPQWLSGDRLIAYIYGEAGAPFAMETTYTITVSEKIKDINGHYLSGPFVFSFVPEPIFRVTGTTAWNGAVGIDRAIGVRVSFNSRLDGTTAVLVPSITPPVEGSWGFFDARTVLFTPASSFEPKTIYTITIGTSMRDEAGRYLPEVYTTTFTTGD